MAEHDFPHLPIPYVLEGRAKLPGGGSPSEEQEQNRANRGKHADKLRSQLGSSREYATSVRANRDEEGLPPLPADIPFLLRLDPGDNPDFLLSLGLEIVAESSDGIILVSANDVSIGDLEAGIEKFRESQRGGGSVVRVHELISSENVHERLQRVLSEELHNRISEINSDQPLVVDVGVECQGTIRLPEYTTSSDPGRIEAWHARSNAAYDQIENLQIEREQQLQEFVEAYGGQVVSIFQEDVASYSLADSFTVRIEIPGNALLDLASNYPFVFDIQEADSIEDIGVGGEEYLEDGHFELLPPSSEAKGIAIVDSGIQSGHPFLGAAVSDADLCLIPGRDGDTADYCLDGGHGTRVASAALHGLTSLPANEDTIQAEFWIKNIRVLDDNCDLPEKLFPPVMMQRVVEFCDASTEDIGTVNLSVNGRYPARKSYMAAWAATIDDLAHENDVLIVVSAGNLAQQSYSSRLGYISAHENGEPYPAYFERPGSRIANPAQSHQALTVGAANLDYIDELDRGSWAGPEWPASYSASGFGMWGAIKPEVSVPVGDFVFSKTNPVTATYADTTSAILSRSTFHGGPLASRDGLGTSYAAPVAASVSARIHNSYPNLSALTRKALIVSSAKWPEWAENGNEELALRTTGYGVIDAERAIADDEYRISFVTDGFSSIQTQQTHIYKIKVPEEIRASDNTSQIKVAVTLCFSARPRRTRSTLKRYYSTWVDWRASRRSESFESFSSAVCKDVDEDIEQFHEGTFPWFLGRRRNYGAAAVNLSNSTCQKDWFVVPAHDLPDEFCVAVQSHKGWDPSPDSEAKYALVVAFESLGQELPVYGALEVALQELEQSLQQTIDVTT